MVLLLRKAIPGKLCDLRSAAISYLVEKELSFHIQEPHNSRVHWIDALQEDIFQHSKIMNFAFASTSDFSRLMTISKSLQR